MHTLTFSASRVTCGRRRAGRRPFTPRRCPCRPPAAPGEQTVKGTGLSGALKDVTSNIDDRRLFVRAVPYAAGSPRGYLADFVVCTYSSFSTYPAPGSGLAPFPASRLRASLSPVAASLDASDRALQPLYRLPRLLAPTRGSAPSAGPNTQPSGAPAGAMPRSCVVPVLRPITQRHHATSTHQCPRRQCHIQPDLCHRHRSSRCLRAASTTADTAPNHPRSCFLLGHVTLSRRRRNPHRSSRELLPERQVQST